MTRGAIVTIGNFDGVHRGHQAILARGRELADERRCPLLAITFHPHPSAVLRPGSEPALLMDLAGRTEALRAAGADEVQVLEPTPALLAQAPEQFVDWLVEQHRPVAIVEGPDFRFGRDRRGDSELLARCGSQHGFAVHVVPRLELALSDLLQAPVTSSLVRWLLRQGRVADAMLCLGRAHELGATVVKGEQRGASLGTPTANLDARTLRAFALPADGVYVGRAVCDDGETRVAAISVGSKPTFGMGTRTIEAHLLDFAGDLYGRPLRLQFARWLRDQQRFSTIGELRRQLQRDISRARQLERLQYLDAGAAPHWTSAAQAPESPRAGIAS